MSCFPILRALGTLHALSWSSYPKPDKGEVPNKDWLSRCGFGVNCDPFLDNLHGWLKNTGFKMYPRPGSLDIEMLQSAAVMICDGYGDPSWDYMYMKECLDVSFSVQVEAFLCTVVKILAKETIPCYGIPSAIDNDQCTPFVSKVTQRLCQY